MYSMPIRAVPKPGSTDLHMVTDQSAGQFSLNSMIPRDGIKGYPLDSMKHLGEELLFFRRVFGNQSLMLFKSDVSEAYHLMPVHPFWQIKQVNTIDSYRSVDRCNAFGGRGSGCIWISLNGLVTWIARYLKDIPRLLVYSDDSYSIVKASSLVKYEPFNKFMPADQVTLMNLWMELGIPFKEEKQLFGSPLTIIGIEVDPNAMTFTLPQSKRIQLLTEIKKFCDIPHHS